MLRRSALLLACALAASCGEPASAGKTGSDTPPAPPETAKITPGEIRIQIKLAGRGFPTSDELTVRNRLEDLILERKIGEVVDTGAGEGHMELCVEVRDLKAARRKIDQAIVELDLGARATIKERSK